MTHANRSHPSQRSRAAEPRPLVRIGLRRHRSAARRLLTGIARIAPASAAAALAIACASAAARVPTAGAATVKAGATEASARGDVAPALRVLATTDFHGHLLPGTYPWSRDRAVGGAAVLAAYFRRERDAAAAHGTPTLLVDGGDLMQGTPVSNLTAGKSTIAFYDSVGYAAAVLGNHDFDWGVDTLRARLAQARFPWLAANVVVAGTDTAPSWIRATAMLDLGGTRVGVIGLAGEETPTTTRPDNVAGLAFQDGAAALDAWVPRLRAEGADFVVVLAHAGAFCDEETDGRDGSTVLERGCRGEVVDWARRTRQRPDLIVAGHTHRPIETRVNGVTIVEAASYGTRYDVVDLRRVSGDSVMAEVRFVTPWSDAIRPDSAVAALVSRYQAEIGPRVGRVVARLAAPLEKRGPQYALGDLIADAQRAATHADASIVNNGGIRRSLPAGALTWGDLYELQPFGNRLVVLGLTGAQLRGALEHAIAGRGPSVHVSGVRVLYDPARAPGRRIVRLTLDGGAPIQARHLYTVTVNDFMADGGSGFDMLSNAASRSEAAVDDLNALIDYLKGLPQPVRAPSARRIRAVDGPPPAPQDR